MGRFVRLVGIIVGTMAGFGASLVLAAETGAAPVIYNPKSPLYQLDTQWAPALLLVLGLGLLFGILGRRWFNLYRSRVAPGQVLRHRALHAIFHWVNALGFIMGLLSGAMLLKWIGGIGELNEYRLHFLGAAFILFAMGSVAIRTLVFEPGKHSIRISGEDLRELRHELLIYLGLAGNRGFLGYGKRNGAKESEGLQTAGRRKYLATERVLSYPLWVIISGVLVITGIIKALRYVTGMPADVLTVATKLHDWSAVAVPFMLLLHAGAVILIRTNHPLLKSMFTLTLPEKFGKDE